MNARFSRLVLSVVVVIIFVLGVVPLAGAREGPKPEAVGSPSRCPALCCTRPVLGRYNGFRCKD